MSDLYCGKYNFGIITERNNRFWKLGRSHAPAARIKNTTGTLRSTPSARRLPSERFARPLTTGSTASAGHAQTLDEYIV